MFFNVVFLPVGVSISFFSRQASGFDNRAEKNARPEGPCRGRGSGGVSPGTFEIQDLQRRIFLQFGAKNQYCLIVYRRTLLFCIVN